MMFRGSSDRPWVPIMDDSPPFGAPGENIEEDSAVGVAVPELLPELGREEVEAKRVDIEAFDRLYGKLAREDDGEPLCLGKMVDSSVSPYSRGSFGGFMWPPPASPVF